MIRFAVVFCIFWIFASIAQANETQQVWRAEMSCGNYDSIVSSGVRFDQSRYTLVIGKALDQSGLKRSLTLYENNLSGSYEMAVGADCTAVGGQLECNLGRMQIRMDPNQTPKLISYDQGRIYVYPALITVKGQVFGSKSFRGDCQVRF